MRISKDVAAVTVTLKLSAMSAERRNLLLRLRHDPATGELVLVSDPAFYARDGDSGWSWIQ